MLKEVGASGQISLGKKYAGQLFDLQTGEDGSLRLTPVKVVPMLTSVQENVAPYAVATQQTKSGQGDGWLTPERLARRAGAAARSPAEIEAVSSQWEEENKDAVEAMNRRMEKIGSMGLRVHAWRKAKALEAPNPSVASNDKAI